MKSEAPTRKQQNRIAARYGLDRHTIQARAAGVMPFLRAARVLWVERERSKRLAPHLLSFWRGP